MKKLTLFIVLAFMYFCNVKAQNADLFRFYLKSGLVLKGELIRIIPDSLVFIKQYGLINSLKLNQIDSIIFEETKEPLPVIRNAKPIVPKHIVDESRRQLLDSAWHLGIQTGLSFGLDNVLLLPGTLLKFSILKNNGKHCMYGTNFGFEPYTIAYNTLIGAIDLEGRYLFKKQASRSGFVYGLGGYGFNLNSSDKVRDGGGNYAFGIGQSMRTKHGVIFSIMGSYKHQFFRSSYSVFNIGASYSAVFIDRFEIKAEWRF